MRSVSPVTHFESSDAKKTAAGAMSSGVRLEPLPALEDAALASRLAGPARILVRHPGSLEPEIALNPCAAMTAPMPTSGTAIAPIHLRERISRTITRPYFTMGFFATNGARIRKVESPSARRDVGSGSNGLARRLLTRGLSSTTTGRSYLELPKPSRRRP